MGNEMWDDSGLYGTVNGVPVEDILGIPVEAFELWPLFGRWYLEVPYRHATYGWPLVWRIRLRRDRDVFGAGSWY